MCTSPSATEASVAPRVAIRPCALKLSAIRLWMSFIDIRQTPLGTPEIVPSPSQDHQSAWGRPSCGSAPRVGRMLKRPAASKADLTFERGGEPIGDPPATQGGLTCRHGIYIRRLARG